MFFLTLFLLFSVPAWSMNISEPISISTKALPISTPEHNNSDSLARGPSNGAFNNVRIYNTLHTKDLAIENNATIGGNIKVNGTVIGGGVVTGPTSSTPGAIACFADASGLTLKNSSVIIDDTGNMSGITTLTAITIYADLDGTASAAHFVGGQSAASVAAATVLALSATSDDIPNTIVRRDNFGNFITTMITLTAQTTHATDAATKSYVDQTAGSGIVTKTPVRATRTTNLMSLNGPQTVDDVALIVGDRVLLTEQSIPTENGIWEVRAGAWTPRPTDFASGEAAGTAYVLTTSGTIYAGSGWICTTPKALIDTDTLSFVQFSSPGSVTGQNVGTGTGTLFKNKTGNLINIKTLIAGDNIIITNNSDDITLTASAQSGALANTLVLRDSDGNFSAGTITATLTGTASENVLRSGDTMTGNLTLIDGESTNPSLQFAGSTNTGISAFTPNKISFDTTGAQRMSIDDAGTVIINQFIGSEGVVHTSNTGVLSSSLIVNADISPSAQIQNSKLAQITSPNTVANSATSATSAATPNTIVLRDNNGDFFANKITAETIIGATTNNVLKAGDTMLGTFTVIQGSAANPSLQFAGSNNTGLSAKQPNTLVFSTDGIERMSINQTGTVTLLNTLVLAAGTVAQPSLQFAQSSHTGISSPTPNKLSFSTNGNERMSMDDTSITVTSVAFILNNVLCMQSTQTVGPLSGGTTYPDFTINNGVSTFIIVYGLGGGVTDITNITLPSNPIEGQLITIKAIRLDGTNLNINGYTPAFSPANEGITQLSPGASLAAIQGGATVTYIWLTTSSGVEADGWYRYGRG